MNKRIYAIGISVALLSATNALASRAKLTVMGTGDPLGILSAGSFYYDDDFNTLYNPSYANDMKNYVRFERTNLASVNGQNTGDGGFVLGMDSFSVGAYLNYTQGIYGSYGVNNKMRPIELILAGDTGIKWGLIGQFANWQSDTDLTANEINLKGGIQVGGFDPFFNITLVGSDKLTGTESTYKDMTFGVRYHLGDWVPYAAYRQDSIGSSDVKAQKFGLGIGRNMKPVENATLRYSMGFFRHTGAQIGGRSVLPVTVAVESEVASWMVGRVGMTYNLYDRTGMTSGDSRTQVGMGATLKAGKLAMDFAIGGGGAVGDPYSQSFDFSNGLFTVASLNYSW